MNLLVSLRSELVKTKKTSALYVTLIVAVFIPLMLFISRLSPAPPQAEKPTAWDEYFFSGHQLFNYFFLPIFIILVSTLLMQIEYRNNTWKQVFTAPQKLWKIFCSKFMVLHLLIVVLIITYNLFMMLGAWALDLILADADFLSYTAQWKRLIQVNMHSYFTTIGISALAFWFALRFKNFLVPVGVGFCLWFIGPLMLFESGWLNADKYIFALPAVVVLPKYQSGLSLYQWLSVGYGFLFLSLAFAEFSMRKVRV